MTLRNCPGCKKPQTTRNARFEGAGEIPFRCLTFTCNSCGSSFALIESMKRKVIPADPQTLLILRELGHRLSLYRVNEIPVVRDTEVWYIGLEGSLDLAQKTLTLTGAQTAIDQFMYDHGMMHGLMSEPSETA